nr:MAG TPA: ATP synthase F1 subunit alpha protein [Caudoviricetes sp.]DAW36547.1 MAG TPA: ATP synthase F1 subunit alpha protein [Caudoviricetes sp.]
MPKGRSKELIERRNRDLYKDYRHLMDVKKLRYSAIITMLSEKYYISEFTVLDVLRSCIREEDEPKESKKEFTGFRVSRWKSRAQSSQESLGELFVE